METLELLLLVCQVKRGTRLDVVYVPLAVVVPRHALSELRLEVLA
jgi:hypothetical protein